MPQQQEVARSPFSAREKRYINSRPVRVGNAAYTQLQLDIYGELLDSIYLHNKYGRPISHDLWQYCHRIANWVSENWDQPDEGT